MSLICIQCAMKALLAGDPPPQFDETEKEHIRKHHPDPTATKAERKDLEKQLEAKLTKEGF